MRTTNYPYIQRYGAHIGLPVIKIFELVSKAQDQNAPWNSFTCKGGVWHVVSEIEDLDIRVAMGISTKEELFKVAKENRRMISIQKEISFDLISDILELVSDSATVLRYWMEIYSVESFRFLGKIYNKSIKIRETNVELDDEPVKHVVTHDMVADSIQQIINGTFVPERIVKYITDAVIENDAGFIDTEALDAILQIAIYKEMTYG